MSHLIFEIILYAYLAAIVVSFICSLRSFRWSNSFHLKLFSVLLGVTAVGEVVFQTVLPWIHVSGRYRNFFYNCFFPVEVICYVLFFFLITKNTWVKRIQILFIVCVPVLWTLFIYDRGLFLYHGEQFAAGTFFVVCFALTYILQLSYSRDITTIRTHCEFWIAIGLVLNYSCQTPFLGTIAVLTRYMSLAAVRVLMDISIVVNTLMYCIFSYAFLCRKEKYS